MSSSILDDVKKVLGIDPSHTEFDVDVIMHINTAFGILQQIGVGPVAGFMITDNTALWSAFTSSDLLYFNMVRTYIYLKTKSYFDPPPTSFALNALKDQLLELEVRLNTNAELYLPPSDPSAGTYWWDMTGLTEFPTLAVDGDIGWDSITGDVWQLRSSGFGAEFLWEFA
jgi:hypothetical protein